MILEAGTYRVPHWRQFDWLWHGFGTRTPGSPEVVLEYAWLKQVHSATVLVANGPGCFGEGDALITNHPGLAVGIRTADCIPILLADPVRRAVAAVHAGWRGTAGGIVPAAIVSLNKEYGSQPANLVAAIGPGIGGCCYEVGPEVAGEFAQLFPERTDLNRKTKVDLAEANRRQLLSAGLAAQNISVLSLCTYEDTSLESFRRDGAQAGRMTAAIGIR